MGITYKIKPGDNLSTIASKYGTTVGAIASANGIANPNKIYANQDIIIPSASTLTADNSKLSGAYVNPPDAYTPLEYDDFTTSSETDTALDNKNNYDSLVGSYGDFGYTNQSKLDEYTSKWENRPDFSYNVNADALYQQYKDKYIQQGKMAMADAIGQASAMTGGYGNSYAATVGNQAYQSHLQQLNDMIPELYQLAYDKYNQEGQDLLNTINMLKGERDYEYGVWSDKYKQLLDQQSYWGDQYLGLYDRDRGIYESDRNSAQSEHQYKETAKYNQYRDRIEDDQWQKNYELSERELAMSEEAWELEKQAYNNAAQTTQQNTNPTKDDKDDKVGGVEITYDSIVDDLNAFIKFGADKSEISELLRRAWKEGHITQSEYNELKETFVPRGSTY